MLTERITLPSGRVINMNGIIKPGDIIKTDDGWKFNLLSMDKRDSSMTYVDYTTCLNDWKRIKQYLYVTINRLLILR
jgi:hypothetical protein